MYDKNLNEAIRLRLSQKDMDFLRKLSEERNVSVSEVIRSMIGEYRRSLDMLDILSTAVKLANEKGEKLSNGDTETDIINQL